MIMILFNKIKKNNVKKKTKKKKRKISNSFKTKRKC